MKKILITSVGSLVGQNILDVLEMRRENLFIIGINSVAENARNFRCDKVFLVPQINDTDCFEEAFQNIFLNEMPDLVLAGRDSDVVFLSEFREKNPLFADRLPFGSSEMAMIVFDKLSTFNYTIRNKLPFADTLLYQNENDQDLIESFISLHGFPLVCKPRYGNGSLNVFFIPDQFHLDRMINSGIEFMLQEYLCPDEKFQNYVNSYNIGIPLFFQIPEMHHYVAQSVIGKGGKILGSIKTRHVMVGGKAELSEVFSNNEIEEIVNQYLEALIKSGWIGFINMQYKPDRFGKWKIFELNPRMVGATSSRFLLGFDELGLLINSFFPDWNFKEYKKSELQSGKVFKYLTDYYVSNQDIEKLKDFGYWQKKQQIGE